MPAKLALNPNSSLKCWREMAGTGIHGDLAHSTAVAIAGWATA